MPTLDTSPTLIEDLQKLIQNTNKDQLAEKLAQLLVRTYNRGFEMGLEEQLSMMDDYAQAEKGDH